VVKVGLPRAEAERVVPLTVDQVRALADAMPQRYRAMVTVQAGLGLRLGELLALRTEDVNFLGRTVRIEQQIASGSRVRSEPKTPRSRRTLPLPTVVAEVLAAHMQAFPAGVDGTLFTNREGRPLTHFVLRHGDVQQGRGAG
jgi:integrase